MRRHTDVCRRNGISSATYYNWKSKYGGMPTSVLRELREAELELSKLKRMYARLETESHALRYLVEIKL